MTVTSREHLTKPNPHQCQLEGKFTLTLSLPPPPIPVPIAFPVLHAITHSKLLPLEMALPNHLLETATS